MILCFNCNGRDRTIATYNIPILIQKLNVDTEIWEDYYPTHAKINKTTGKEYFAASTIITSSTYHFEVRYCEKIGEILFDTEIYSIVYKGRRFNIKNIDRKQERHTKVIFIGDCSGKNKYK